MRYTKKQIEAEKEKLLAAKEREESIQQKYSANYDVWCKACDKVNMLNSKVKKMIACYNYDNGFVKPSNGGVV